MTHRRTDHALPARHTLRSARIALASVALVSLAAITACGSDGTAAGGGGTSADPPVTDPRGTASSAGKGWIDGEPDWDAGAGDAAGGAPAVLDAAVPSGAESGVAAPEVAEPAPQSQPALRAGSVDDNADFDGFLAYLDRYAQLGNAARPYDPTGRVVATVTGANGLPIDGMDVTVSLPGGTEPVAVLQTAADGQVIFLPAEHGQTATSYVLTADGVSTEVAAGASADLSVPTEGGAAAGMAVDVLFLLDVTGSMGDEIAQLKATISDVAAQLESLPQQPDIRFGMTLFRDEGDAFVTSTYDLTDDVAAFQAALDTVEADGGGDTPEAVDEAFAAALGEPSWRDPASTVQLVFLVGDAAPQVARQVPQPYTASIQAAASRGITVHVVAASQTDDPAEHAFREIAQGTGGRFVFLSYGAAGAATGPSTDIAATDYEELSLDALVVRLVGEELAALTGETFTAPVPDSTVVPTDPPGQ